MRKIAKKNILINGINTFELDEVGVFFYKQFNGTDDLKTIAEKIAEHYNIDFEMAHTDLQEFAEKLIDEKIIVPVE